MKLGLYNGKVLGYARVCDFCTSLSHKIKDGVNSVEQLETRGCDLLFNWMVALWLS